VSQGIARCDSDLFEVAKVYRLGALKKLKYFYLPQVASAFATACSTSMGLTWKAVIAAEVLGTPKLAMGSAMYASKIYLETADLFAWTLVVIALSVVLERSFARLMNRISRRWGWEGMT
jgi:NitT/TauT family transport system permease protein